MQITRQALARRWLVTTLAAAAVFAVLAVLDLQLKGRTGFGTIDLQGFSTAAEYRQAFLTWPSRDAARAGFEWGLDYLLMPLYALAFFYSGVIAREGFAPRPGRLRRILGAAVVVPVAGAMLDAIENVLEFSMLVNGPTDALARVAFTVSNAKMVAIYVGVILLAGAVVARVQERVKARLRQQA